MWTIIILVLFVLAGVAGLVLALRLKPSNRLDAPKPPPTHGQEKT